MRKAVFRGLFFLILVIIVTYYGKFRPRKAKIVTDHGLLGWVFKSDSSMSVLVVFPNDADYSNQTATGERIFFNPLPHPSLLDSNFIRYNKKDLFLAGRLRPQHVKNYCREVDSLSTLFYWGPREWARECPKAARVPYQASRITRDWEVQTKMVIDSATGGTFIRLSHQGQNFVFTNQASADIQPDSCLMYVSLNGDPKPKDSNIRLLLSPGSAVRDNHLDSSLIISGPEQVLGFILKESGELQIKKLWLTNPVHEAL